ncbi:family S53 protease [Mycena galopus ATCC 62051]|nr:family S53 protease [Mycena galopus ATCC 62051]
MRGIAFLPLAALLSACTANPLLERAMAVHESIPAVPSGFVHAGAVSPAQGLTLRIALAQADMPGLQAKTYAVSDPANALYGQHLTAEEVTEYVAPTEETLSAVSEWLSENGITAKSISPAGDVLQISLPASQANALFAAQFSAFTHTASGTSSIRTLSYSLPAALTEHIQFVHPTVVFTPPLSNPPGMTAINHKRDDEMLKRTGAVPASCTSKITPACVQALYGIPTTKATSSGNIIAVSGYANQFANSQDLSLFLTAMRPDMVNTTNFALQTLDGGSDPQYNGEAGSEADLDIEYTVGIASGVPVTFISIAFETTDDVDGFIDIVNFILKEEASTRPTVLTTSYGFNENQLTRPVAVAVCNAYTQLAALGISVLFASGDGGVSGLSSGSCSAFVPTTPGSCPFVTSVGGSAGLPPQVAAPLSAGGFSNYFPTPAYQLADVTAYLASIGGEYAGLYNKSGRGLPDVAAQAINVEIYYLVNGTSCATPIFASIIALVNDRLLAAGKPVLGFLNPFLYSAAGRAAFTDVTSGTNPGCNTAGFSASKGWDPVTGLGTPNFDLLLTAAGL